jgi:hypothetical protein
MTDVHVLFLNADFVLADGSYERLLPHLLAGERVVLSPSYCTVEERVQPLLCDARDPRTGVLSVAPRRLAQSIIDHRHTTIRAKTVNQRRIHFEYMDQFYWELDARTLLGHQMPIALVAMRPEVALPDVTTFWDWGVVYDFCPSRRLAALGDSDDFLMMELRPAGTYLDSVRPGRRSTREIAASLATYITQYQLDTARFALTLHAGALPPGVDTARAALRAFAEEVLSLLPSAPISHHNHPQWQYHTRYFETHPVSGATGPERARLEDEPRSAAGRRGTWRLPRPRVLRRAWERLRARPGEAGPPAEGCPPPPRARGDRAGGPAPGQAAGSPARAPREDR